MLPSRPKSVGQAWRKMIQMDAQSVRDQATIVQLIHHERKLAETIVHNEEKAAHKLYMETNRLYVILENIHNTLLKKHDQGKLRDQIKGIIDEDHRHTESESE